MAAPKQIKRKRELDDEEEDEFTKRFLKADELTRMGKLKKKVLKFEELDDEASRESELTKSGRVRKKSTKLREMEEFEEIEKKQTSTKKTPIDPTKKPKTQLLNIPGHMPVSPKKLKPSKSSDESQSPVMPQKTEDIPSKGSVIKFLLSSPTQPSTPVLATHSVLKTKPESLLTEKSSPLKKSPKPAKSKTDMTLLQTLTSSLSSLQSPAKKQGDTELKYRLIVGSNPSVVSSGKSALSVDTTTKIQSEVVSDASTKDGSLKMKFILSPKDKTLGQSLSSSANEKAQNDVPTIPQTIAETKSPPSSKMSISNLPSVLPVPVPKAMPIHKTIPTPKPVSASKMVSSIKTIPSAEAISIPKTIPGTKEEPDTKELPKVIPITNVIPGVKTITIPKNLPVVKPVPAIKVVPVAKPSPPATKIVTVKKPVSSKNTSQNKSPSTSKSKSSTPKATPKTTPDSEEKKVKKAKKKKGNSENSIGSPSTPVIHKTVAAIPGQSGSTVSLPTGRKTSPTSVTYFSAAKAETTTDLSKFDFTDEPNLVIAEPSSKTATKTKKSPSSRPPSKKKAKIDGDQIKTKPEDIKEVPEVEMEFFDDETGVMEEVVTTLPSTPKTKSPEKKSKKSKKAAKDDPDKPAKKRRAPTAYMLWCNANRSKVVSENPKLDFAQISRRLGEIWQGLTEKEKMTWKQKAKKAAGKGSTLIRTGKGSSKSVSNAAPAPATSTAPVAVAKSPSTPASKVIKSLIEDMATSPVKGLGIEPVDAAAHLKLLGESLSIIGMRLQEHKGMIAVQGGLSVLLDSMLCAFSPLMCLTAALPEINGCPRATLSKTLDNIAYIMPGL